MTLLLLLIVCTAVAGVLWLFVHGRFADKFADLCKGMFFILFAMLVLAVFGVLAGHNPLHEMTR
jgi:hypothetical protein